LQTPSKNIVHRMPQPQMPPLVSVNSAQPPLQTPPQTVPRVQTIQLTPQKQQHLKNVQMQIQQLSAKLQNKSLLSTLTIPIDFDPNNPIHNEPLPVLNNIQAMTDPEIHKALQRLFIEQKKILASGKIIPTIPSGHTFGSASQVPLPAATPVQPPPAAIPINAVPPMNPIPIKTEPKVQQSIVSPITATSAANNPSMYSGGANLQTIPSPIQINSPQVIKHEVMQPASSTTSTTQALIQQKQIQQVKQQQKMMESVTPVAPLLPTTPIPIVKTEIKEEVIEPPEIERPTPQASPKIKVPRPCL
jgi:nuclear receptor coactivator 6